MLGVILGSFAATVVVRIPRGEGLGGRSRCDGCGATIRAIDLVPLGSWLVRRGRCAICGAAIDPLHPIVEGLCAALGALLFAVLPPLEAATGLVFGVTLVALAALDVRHLWLPDLLTLPLLGAGLAVGLLALDPTPTERAIGAAVGWSAFAALAALYRRIRGRDGLGGGDAKLLAAIGAWTGWAPLPFVVVGASGAALIFVLVLVARGRAVTATTRLPFGAFLAAAAVPVWLLLR